MGKTQGVNRAINPPTIPNKKTPQRDFSPFFSPQSPIGLSKSIEEILYLLLSNKSDVTNEFWSLFFFLIQKTYLHNQVANT